MATTNGNAPTQDAKRLAQRDYADRVLANLGEQRLITDRFLREFGVFDPEHVSIADMKRMRRDTMIKMGLYYSKAPQISAEYSIKCEDPQIAAAMTEIVGDVRQSWMRTALNKLDFGFQAAVKNYELGKVDATYEDPRNGEVRQVWDDPDVQPVILGRPIPIPPDYARVALDKGRFDGIDTHMSVKDANDSDAGHIPAEWALWFVNEFEEEFGNYYGTSRILSCYEAWYAYWFTFHMRSRHVEMDADPALQVWYPPGTWKDPATGQTKSNRDAALEIGAMLRGGATIAWPSDVYVDEQGKAAPVALWRAEFLKGGENLGAFQQVLDHLEILKLRGCLVPEEALVAHTGGLNSGSKVASYGQIFTESLEMDARYLDEIWTKHQIRDIVEANWGKEAPKCALVTEGFKDEDLQLAVALIEAAFQADPNALPIDFEELLQRAGIPMLTAKEQQEREEAAAEAAKQAQEEAAAAAEAAGGDDPNAPVPPGGDPAAPGAIGPLPGETPQQLAASQDRHRTKPRKYEREVIYLGDKARTAPGWARREGARRDRNVQALAERLGQVAEARYADAFDAAAEALIEADGLQLGVGDTVAVLIDRIRNAVANRVAAWRRPVQGELASVYHTSGAAELVRLGLSADSWDVGRDEVQEWARFRAGELVKTIDKTVVEKHIRPWLTTELQNLGIQDGGGIPYGTLELAQRLTDKFSSYPQWMAERLVRTEARLGYNESAADMWERVGVQEVEEYDGLGGRTGQTDEECLRRNGQRVTIAEFREDNRKEHPNGTLGAIPITNNVELRPLGTAPQASEVLTSLSLYVVTDDGTILSEAETGALLAQKGVSEATGGPSEDLVTADAA